MNFKRVVIALIAAAGVGAIAFGGSAVSTAFTSESSHHAVDAQGATLAPVMLFNGDISARGLLPGAPADVITPGPAIRNDNSFKVSVTITFKHFVVVHNGTNGRFPDPGELLFGVDNAGPVSAEHLQGRTFSLGTLDAHSLKSYRVTAALLSTAGNEWQGADGFLPYTVTLSQHS